VGKLKITKKQASRLGIEPYRRLSPILEKCCLLLAANESFQDAENDLKVLTGLEVGHSTHHRQVQKVALEPPNVKQKLTEVAIDGGKVRLRSKEKGSSAYWKEYKTGRLQGIYYGAFFQDNMSLISWVNSQNLAQTIYCLGDGHDGVWNLFAAIAETECRQEILDWYHLKENLYKIQAPKKFLSQIEAELWHGQVEEGKMLLRNSKYVGATNFINYLAKHRHRLVNYMYFQAEQLSSIGSGAVESAVKQIDKRLQIVGAQWKSENLPQMLQLRCAYLNGQLQT
jgi:hypothetical protein